MPALTVRKCHTHKCLGCGRFGGELTCSPNTRESAVGGALRLDCATLDHRVSEARLCYARPCLTEKINCFRATERKLGIRQMWPTARAVREGNSAAGESSEMTHVHRNNSPQIHKKHWDVKNRLIPQVALWKG